MIKLHHLNNSRSQRIIWLFEELGVPYEVVHHKRMAPIPLAPPELKEIHPLGKSPVIEDNGKTIAESGAIIEYVIDTYGNGKLKPKTGTDEYWKYIEWMHYAEGSAMLPMLMHMYLGYLGDAAAPLRVRVDSEIANHLSYIVLGLGSREFIVGSEFTGADVQMCFVMEAADASGLLKPYAALSKYLASLQARPAYKRAIEKGGPYDLTMNRRASG